MKQSFYSVAIVTCSIACYPTSAFGPIISYRPRWSSRDEYPSVPKLPIAISLPQKQMAVQMKRSHDNSAPSVRSRREKVPISAVNGLILLNTAIFFADKVFRMPFIMQHLYLIHNQWKWWQLLTSCFCHGWGFHLCSNMFALHLFGRVVEDELGWRGLLLSFSFCGICGKIASLLVKPNLPHCTIGASGAVYGLFVLFIANSPSWKELLDWDIPAYIAALWILVLTGGSLLRLSETTISINAPVLVFELLMLIKLSWRQFFDWRILLEVACFRQLVSDLSKSMQGVRGKHGNNIGHLAGAAAGVLLMLGMKVTEALRHQKRFSKRRKRRYFMTSLRQ